jgi:NAD(P)-dependent dehydrogenase (short-subunit alcohol dehydrogenase family)
MQHENRVVIVTGAGGSGCGRSIAARLAMDGAAIVVSDINEAGAQDTVERLSRLVPAKVPGRSGPATASSCM